MGELDHESNSYPVLLHLKGRHCVVVGGGKVAARKVAGLLASGARVTVISPVLNESLAELASTGRIDICHEPFTTGMLAAFSPFLVFAATDSAEVNRQVAAEAATLGVLVDVVDSSTEGTFTGMAAFRRGLLTVAISTHGASPLVAAQLRDQLQTLIGPEYAILLDWLAELRDRVRGQVASERDRRRLWQSILDSHVLEHLRQGDENTARAILDRLVADSVDGDKRA